MVDNQHQRNSEDAHLRHQKNSSDVNIDIPETWDKCVAFPSSENHSPSGQTPVSESHKKSPEAVSKLAASETKSAERASLIKKIKKRYIQSSFVVMSLGVCSVMFLVGVIENPYLIFISMFCGAISYILYGIFEKEFDVYLEKLCEVDK